MARSILMAAAEEERLKRYSNINRRMIREASKLLMLPEKEFVGHYRLHKSHFETLCEDVIPLLPETQRTSAVRPEKGSLTYKMITKRSGYILFDDNIISLNVAF